MNKIEIELKDLLIYLPLYIFANLIVEGILGFFPDMSLLTKIIIGVIGFIGYLQLKRHLRFDR